MDLPFRPLCHPLFNLKEFILKKNPLRASAHQRGGVGGVSWEGEGNQEAL